MDPTPETLEVADAQRLEDLVDREAFSEVCSTFFDLFGLPLRVFAHDGRLLAEVHQQRAICSYVNSLQGGRRACHNTVSAVRELAPTADGVIEHPCFTGAVYRVMPIRYDGRNLGRFVLGPYVPSETQEVPNSLLQIDPGLDPAQAVEALNEMPRVRGETADSIVAHAGSILDLLLFSGHRAYLTSHMHLASVRASFRELSENNVKLQRAYDELRELDRLKSNFLATISHELRTPLTSIIGYSEMLGTGIGGELTDEQQSFVETIRNKGDQLLELITSLLDMARFEQGKVDIKRRRLDIHSLVEDVMKTSRRSAERRKVTLHSDIAERLPPISADAERLRQVLQNLMDNAIKFTEAGGEVRLEVRAGELPDPVGLGGAGAALLIGANRALEFTVCDTGIGIPPEKLARIFDAFYQVDGSVTREHGGAGLGLSIVQRLVEAHGGHLWAESVVGEGSKFHVVIPEDTPLSP